MFSVHYLSNSGFTLETEDYFFVFDDEGKTPDGYSKKDFVGKRAVFFCASHSHGDHFSPHIFNFSAPNVHYLLSYEIGASGERIHSLVPGQTLDVEGVCFTATDSTDLGISLTVKLPGLQIFHAGDLNDWHWKDYSTPAQAQAMEALFLSVLSTVDPGMDLAFFPVDPRLGTDYDRGAELFLEAFHPRYFFPMHFREATDAPLTFAQKYAGRATRIVPLTASGDSFGGDL